MASSSSRSTHILHPLTLSPPNHGPNDTVVASPFLDAPGPTSSSSRHPATTASAEMEMNQVEARGTTIEWREFHPPSSRSVGSRREVVTAGWKRRRLSSSSSSSSASSSDDENDENDENDDDGEAKPGADRATINAESSDPPPTFSAPTPLRLTAREVEVLTRLLPIFHLPTPLVSKRKRGRPPKVAPPSSLAGIEGRWGSQEERVDKLVALAPSFLSSSRRRRRGGRRSRTEKKTVGDAGEEEEEREKFLRRALLEVRRVEEGGRMEYVWPRWAVEVDPSPSSSSSSSSTTKKEEEKQRQSRHVAGRSRRGDGSDVRFVLPSFWLRRKKGKGKGEASKEEEEKDGDGEEERHGDLIKEVKEEEKDEEKEEEEKESGDETLTPSPLGITATSTGDAEVEAPTNTASCSSLSTSHASTAIDGLATTTTSGIDLPPPPPPPTSLPLPLPLQPTDKDPTTSTPASHPISFPSVPVSLLEVATDVHACPSIPTNTPTPSATATGHDDPRSNLRSPRDTNDNNDNEAKPTQLPSSLPAINVTSLLPPLSDATSPSRRSITIPNLNGETTHPTSHPSTTPTEHAIAQACQSSNTASAPAPPSSSEQRGSDGSPFSLQGPTAAVAHPRDESGGSPVLTPTPTSPTTTTDTGSTGTGAGTRRKAPRKSAIEARRRVEEAYQCPFGGLP